MKSKNKLEQLPYLEDLINNKTSLDGNAYNSAIIDSKTFLEECMTAINTFKDKNPLYESSNNKYVWTVDSTGSGTSSGSWKTSITPTTVWPTPSTTYPVWEETVTTTSIEPMHITIHDEYGLPKRLGVAEVSRYYAEALEYRRIKRFARIFPAIKDLLNELLVAIKLSDPYDEEELDKLERERKNIKKY